MNSDADSWNQRYSAAELVWTAQPNQTLVAEVDRLVQAGFTPDTALDWACGEGRNALWLASLGLEVTGVDFAQAGLDKGRTLAEQHGVAVTWVCAEVTEWQPPDTWDLVVVIFLHLPEPQRSAAFRTAAAAVAPGGRLIVLGHDTDNLAKGVGGPQDTSLLYHASDIGSAVETVPGIRVLRSEQVLRPVVGNGDTETRNAIDCLLVAER